LTNPLSLNLTVTPPVRSIQEHSPQAVPRGDMSQRVHRARPTPAVLVDEHASMMAGARPKRPIGPVISRRESDLMQVQAAARNSGSARDGEATAAIAVQVATLSDLLRALSVQVAELSARVDVLDGASCNAAIDTE
jgi:hypothetical protein